MQLEARRTAVRGELKPVGIPPGRPSIFPPRRPQRAPVRAVAIARRRHLAASGPMPPALASKFTVSEFAVLRIVGDEVSGQGACGLTLAEIAARAGVCRRMAQSALREAAGLGLITVQERRREGQVNLPNIVRVVSREWLQWLRIGCKKSDPTVKEFKNPAARTREKRNWPRLRRRTLLVREPPSRGCQRQRGHLQRLPGWDQGGGEDEALMITPARSGARPRGPLRQARASAAACAGYGRSSTPCARKARAPWRPPGAIARAPSACCRTASRSSGRVMSPPPKASNFPQQTA